ncbi:MAG: tetratricopeptide repeat protein [Burkholderiales bacterium]|nr:tetratricopeptide repeat protein [Burkholderiales bacterium]
MAANADETNPVFLRSLGNTLQAQQRWDDALACYQVALQRDPQYADAYRDLGAVLLMLGQPVAAEQALRLAVSLAPNVAENHNNLGVALKNQQRYDEALACYQRALALRPDFPDAMFNIGTVHYLRKDAAAAVQRYLRVLALDPAYARAHQNLALIFEESGHLDEAAQHRQLAFRDHSVFVDPSPAPRRTVLVLWAAGKGNVPIDHLLPREHTTLITWMVAYPPSTPLPAYDLVFNAVGDPDVMGPTLAPSEQFIAQCDKPVLNLPARVARTSRERLPELFADIPRVIVPPIERLVRGQVTPAVLAQYGLIYPLLVRPSGSHGGMYLDKVDDIAALEALVTLHADAYYVSRFHDYRSSDGYYRKYRIVFVNGQPYPYHLAISEHWLVHYETAGMQGMAWKQAEERRFLEDPTQALGEIAMQAINAIGQAMSLEYCGVDFSLLPDGRVLVFEANATMLVHPEPDDSELAYKNPYVRRILEAFERMLP